MTMPWPLRALPALTRRHWLAWAAAAALPAAPPAQAAGAAFAPAPWQRVRFPLRGGARVLRNRLQGPAQGVRDYLVRGRAGQSLEVELETLAPGASLQVLAPQRPQALFMSEFAAVPRWRGQLAADGDYRVRVSLNPVQRRRGDTLAFTLRLALGPG